MTGVRLMQIRPSPLGCHAPFISARYGARMLNLRTPLSALLATVLSLSAAAPAQAATPNDTLYPQQWWLGSYNSSDSAGVANFPKAWDLNKGAPVSGAAPVIAVLDSGVYAHPDLVDRLLLPGYNFVSKAEYANNGVGRNNDPTDTGDALSQAEHDGNPALWDGCAVAPTNSWHGTVIAGQIGAFTNNGKGVAGINWNARILPVRVSGKCGAAVNDMVDGMRWAAGLPVAGAPLNTNPAKILVIGFAGVASCDVNDSNPTIAAAARLYTDAIAELRARHVLIVAAAGNLRGAVGRPANCAGVLGVTALNRQGFKAIYANIGKQVSLAATGGDGNYGRLCDVDVADAGITSTSGPGTPPATDGADYAAATGSSFAAPQVAGTASLMWAANPSLTLAQIEAGLRLSARPHAQAEALGQCSATNTSRCSCTADTCGVGTLDAEEALRYAQAPATYTAPARTAAALSSAALDACGIKQGTKVVPADPVTPTTPTTPTAPTTPEASSGGGGGASSPFWLALLLIAAFGVRRSKAARSSSVDSTR